MHVKNVRSTALLQMRCVLFSQHCALALPDVERYPNLASVVPPINDTKSAKQAK